MINQSTKLNDETALDFSANQTTTFSNRKKTIKETILNYSTNQSRLNDVTNKSIKSINETLNQTVDLAQLKPIEFLSLNEYETNILNRVKESSVRT